MNVYLLIPQEKLPCTTTNCPLPSCNANTFRRKERPKLLTDLFCRIDDHDMDEVWTMEPESRPHPMEMSWDPLISAAVIAVATCKWRLEHRGSRWCMECQAEWSDWMSAGARGW